MPHGVYETVCRRCSAPSIAAVYSPRSPTELAKQELFHQSKHVALQTSFFVACIRRHTFPVRKAREEVHLRCQPPRLKQGSHEAEWHLRLCVSHIGAHVALIGHSSKPMGFWEWCITHFRTYFSGDWDVHWGLTGV